MIDGDKFLTFGAALVKAIKSYIKYSDNLPKMVPLFKPESAFSKNYKSNIEKACINPYASRERIVFGLNNGIGRCGDLTVAAIHIARITPEIMFEERFFISYCVIENLHVFALIHQNESVFNASYKKYKNFQEILDIDYMQNAVIIDLWINKATKLQNYNDHLEHAYLYDAVKYYNNKILIIKELSLDSKKITRYKDVTEIENSCRRRFITFYNDELQKLYARRSSFAQGLRCSNVEESLKYDIDQYNKPLKSSGQNGFNITKKKSLFEERKSVDNSRGSLFERYSCLKEKPIYDVKTVKEKVLTILGRYLKLNSLDPSGSWNITLRVFDQKHHAGRMREVIREVKQQYTIKNISTILEKQKIKFEYVQHKYIGKDEINKRWNDETNYKVKINKCWSNEVDYKIKNIPKKLENSKFYKAICEALDICENSFNL
ncbi:hypothetical protein SD28_06010 [Allofrancisella guangzhouensis]|uniref:Uncharacterized protein n=2 Tax=Allofrancisella guangzhouensis TaxID=594679 RepID=A0A0A8E6J3_9GAMM|nr:hypothetical protein [Allofrancisella guangzhouensis]AJC49217.1 hypothetical protein SD28_06010 [Allofrancisella guangzhouensis]MBK2027584.1 hypothetical protein [Allofrancisella guangzhouensis]MBK2045019.1 hypothetical protein [Allofrancisella guangzhouensis]